MLIWGMVVLGRYGVYDRQRVKARRACRLTHGAPCVGCTSHALREMKTPSPLCCLLMMWSSYTYGIDDHDASSFQLGIVLARLPCIYTLHLLCQPQRHQQSWHGMVVAIYTKRISLYIFHLSLECTVTVTAFPLDMAGLSVAFFKIGKIAACYYRLTLEKN